MGLEHLQTKMAQGTGSGLQFMVGRIVRIDDDDDISKFNTVSVLTNDGTLFRDVLLTYDSRYVRHFPDTPFDDTTLGSLVIIGFLNANYNRPFILKYISDSTLPVPQEPKNFVSWNNGDLEFSSDGYGNTQVSFVGENQQMSIIMDSLDSELEFSGRGTVIVRTQKFEGEISDIKLRAVSIDEESETKKIVTENFEHEVKEKFTETIKEKELTISEKHKEEIKEMEQKIEKLKTEIDSLKAKYKDFESEVQNTLKLKASTLDIIASSKAVLDCKNINLSGSSPSDAPVLFNQLNTLLTQLLTALSTLTVTCTAPGTPSSPPINFAVFQSLSASLTMLKSKFIKID